MPTPPDFKELPLTPDYLWNEKAAQYTNKKTGRFVSRKVIRDQLDKVVDASSDAMAGLARQLQAGQINLAEWQIGMMQQIKITHLAAGAIQKGGWEQMTQADFGRVGRVVRDEYEFLRTFAEQIASADPKKRQKLDGTFNRRVVLYGQAGRGTYYKFWDAEVAKRGFDEERSILRPAKHCTECVDQAALGFQKLGRMTPIGRRLCRSNDRCDKQYRNSLTGEVLSA